MGIFSVGSCGKDWSRSKAVSSPDGFEVVVPVVTDEVRQTQLRTQHGHSARLREHVLILVLLFRPPGIVGTMSRHGKTFLWEKS
jgi:hypothetical protein